MKSFNEEMAAYSAAHQSSGNKLFHYIGVPAVIFGTFMLLNWINIDFGTVWKVSFAWLALIFTCVYYLMLGNYKLAAITTIILLVFLGVAAWVARPYPSVFSGVLFLILFVGGWALLLMGHGMFEKNRPALMNSLCQIFVAPLFLTAEILNMTGIGKQFDANGSPEQTHHHDSDDTPKGE